MQIFSKDITAKNRHYLIRDKYQEQVKNTTNKVIIMQNINLSEYTTTKQALKFYSRGAVLVTVGILTSAISYPISIKIVKKLFGVKNFLNVHMAALPIIVNVNAFVLGVTQGFINSNLLNRRYPCDITLLNSL